VFRFSHTANLPQNIAWSRFPLNTNEESKSSGPTPGPPSANEQFVKQVADKRAGLDSYDPEQSLWTGGYSPKAMFGTWLIVTLISIAIVVAAIIMQTIPWTIVVAVIVGLWGINIAIYAARRLGIHYELTSQRFIHQQGVLSRQTDRIEVIDIDDVSFFQGPIERILGVGTINITGSDRTHPKLTMRGISNVKQVAGLIDDIRRKERKRRSLHIQSM